MSDDQITAERIIGAAQYAEEWGSPEHGKFLRKIGEAFTRLEAERDRYRQSAQTLARECRLLAMLAATEPQFNNPLTVYEAQTIRDRWLVTGEPR